MTELGPTDANGNRKNKEGKNIYCSNQGKNYKYSV